MSGRRRQEIARRRRGVALGQAAWRAAQEATDPTAARAWLERAHRFVPGDRNITFALATSRLAAGEAAAARALFAELACAHDTAEIWTGLAACALLEGDAAAASAALARRLAGFAIDGATEALAHRLAERFGLAFCGVTEAGRLVTNLPGAEARLDGTPVAGPTLPPAWQGAQRLTVHGRATVLGSPIALRRLWRVEGVVGWSAGGLAGWAWHPGMPDRDPELRLWRNGVEIARVVASDLSLRMAGTVPLGRPRRFRRALARDGIIRVTGPDGRDLLGSPLPAPGPSPPAPPADGPARGISIVVPVHGGRAATLACLASVLATLGPNDRLIVVDDASPDPALRRALATLAAAGRIRLLPACPADPGRNLGFPAAANAGLRAAAGDVVLLNSDTLVFPGWLEALSAAAHAAPDIGTVTPVSNAASVFSVPNPDPAENPLPSPDAAARLASLAAAANGGTVVEVPTAHGFCMFIRADCLAATGLLREDVFAQGYGEENDFTERATARGFRHVAAPGVYVRHEGGVSFGPAARHLLARNLGLLEALHPGYQARIAAFAAADPLRESRARLDLARWRAGRQPRGAVLLITHDAGGGTARVVAARAAAARRAGLRPITLAALGRVVTLSDGGEPVPNLRFPMPGALETLTALVAEDAPRRAELHHLLGHDHAILALPRRLGIPYDLFVHDYAWLCPRVVLTTGEARYCGEPEAAVCAVCVARFGRAIEERISAARLRARSAADLAGARRVIVPSADTAARIRRHFPAARPRVRPWDQVTPAPPAGVWDQPRRIAVIGAIGMEKGFEVLLACARDAAARRLALNFIVIGYTVDDAALLQTGTAWVTGPFASGEATALLRAHRPAFAFLPSIWPETWCFALSDAWRAGLDAAVFDIGAPAARVRQAGRGWVLPLGLPPSRVNDALLNIQPVADTPVHARGRRAAGKS